MMNYCNLLTSFLSCIITAYVVNFIQLVLA